VLHNSKILFNFTSQNKQMHKKEQMYGIVNANGKLLMQVDFKEYCFTDNQEIALKYFAEENAHLQIKKLPMLTGLSVIPLK